MKPRTPEASRLEADYLARLRARLAASEPAEADEVLADVRAHIEEALGRNPSAESSLVEMAAVLERLGPPESYVPPGEAETGTGAPRCEGPPAATAEPAPPSSGDRTAWAGTLRKLWWAYLAGTVGLYVPIINLMVCEFARMTILGVSLMQPRPGGPPAFRRVSLLALLSLVNLALVAIVGVASLVVPPLGVLTILFGLAQMFLGLSAYYLCLGGAAWMVQRVGRPDLARWIKTDRLIYIIINIGLLVLGSIVAVAIVLAVGAGPEDAIAIHLVAFAVSLPISWVTGWLFALRPLGRARQALLGQT